MKTNPSNLPQQPHRQRPQDDAPTSQTGIRPDTYLCQHCRRLLPAEAFYQYRGKPDHYCKECRRAASSNRYHRRVAEQTKRQRDTPLITETNDPELRMQLILQAVHVVRESVARKRRQNFSD